MSLYLTVFLLLVGFGAYEYLRQRPQKGLYRIAFGILAAMLCLRWGQGTDYFSYYEAYLQTPVLAEAGSLFHGTIHGEGGWLLLCSLLKTLKLPFWVLVGGISAFEMVCLHRFIRRFSPLWCISLLLAFPTLYLTYAMSALRQGLVLLFFLGYLVEWLYRKQWKAYLLGTLVCLVFHTSAAVFLLPLVLRFRLTGKRMLIAIPLCAAAGYLVTGVLVWFVPAFAAYGSSSVYLPAIGERILSALLLLWLLRDWEPDDRQQLLVRLYLLGCLLYCVLLWNGLIASRMAVYCKAVELALFAAVCKSGTGKNRVAAGYLLTLVTVMYCKNILSYIRQGGYEDTTIWNYPYFSIFDPAEIREFRSIPEQFLFWQ